MSESLRRSYRLYRPDAPLLSWVRQQKIPLIVHRHDFNQLLQAGVQNVDTLPHGGPQPGEVWIELQNG